MSKGHWYCENCDSMVDSASVTYDELHSQCGYKAKWIDNPDEVLRNILSKLVGHEKHYGLYQLCPKCDGEGTVDPIGSSTSMYRTCPVCNGAKLLVRPEINPVRGYING